MRANPKGMVIQERSSGFSGLPFGADLSYSGRWPMALNFYALGKQTSVLIRSLFLAFYKTLKLIT